MSGPGELPQYERGKRCGEDLIGTCDNIEAHAEPGDAFESVEFCEGIDDVAFRCAGCEWWCEAGDCNENPEPGGDNLCSQCYAEVSPDEDD